MYLFDLDLFNMIVACVHLKIYSWRNYTRDQTCVRSVTGLVSLHHEANLSPCAKCACVNTDEPNGLCV